MSVYVDLDFKSLNKNNEELCGDKVEHFRTKDGIIAVLSDGLGSGVKANILATLTSKIAITMLKEGADINEVVDTIAHTLPVCKVRRLAYSTFTIIKISNDGDAYIVEFDNPGVFFLRNSKVLNLKGETVVINNRKIKETRLKVYPEDIAVVVSDGVIHAGVGKTLNLGWQWENVSLFLEEFIVNHNSGAKSVTNGLIGVCEDLYLNKPSDDTTVLSIKVREPQEVLMFSGPPKNNEEDKRVVSELIHHRGKKIVCGGTAAHIVSRELDTDIKTSLDMIDRNIPPIAYIRGIDLVTEGVLTLRAAVDKLTIAKTAKDLRFLDRKDGASILAKMLLEDCTHLKMLVGKAVNPAHQNPDFPQELSIKLNVLEALKEILDDLGKIVTIEYY